MWLIELFPQVQSFGDAVATSAAKVAGAHGKTVPRKKGCGACCLQMVPIAEVEARGVAALVRELHDRPGEIAAS